MYFLLTFHLYMKKDSATVVRNAVSVPEISPRGPSAKYPPIAATITIEAKTNPQKSPSITAWNSHLFFWFIFLVSFLIIP